MSLDQRFETETYLRIPESLQPNGDRTLPELTIDALHELQASGWSRVGLMVAFTDSLGSIMMLEHNGREKNAHLALGPLGETSQHSSPVIEQPLETLFRGIQEELGIQQPADLELWIYQNAGWVINQWPRGDGFPGEFACAISFPIFVADKVKEHLLAIPHGTEEVGQLKFLSPDEILSTPDTKLRPGVKDWLSQMQTAGLFEPETFGHLDQLDFSSIYGSSLRDIELL